VAAASKAPPFLALLAASMGSLLPLLRFLGRLRVENGRVDLKRCSLLPIVSLARGLALRVGSTERSTPGRLRDAVSAERLSSSDASALIELHECTMTLVLGQQLRDLEEGVRPSSRVAMNALSKAEARRLAGQLKHLEQVMENARGAMSA
jgi:signal-transduction protein with cAMP-binding, CBS, and nucleotidyltransferase domain